MIKRIDLSFDNFKKWMNEQDNESMKKENYIGLKVQPTINLKKLLAKIVLEEGNEQEVCKDFFENGGVVKSKEDKQFLIEVSSGFFYIHKMYVEEV